MVIYDYVHPHVAALADDFPAAGELLAKVSSDKAPSPLHLPDGWEAFSFLTDDLLQAIAQRLSLAPGQMLIDLGC